MESLIGRYNKYREIFERRETEQIEDGIRSCYQRDIHRIIYSDAFRRLRHKTQVYFLVNNDHISTRMEHVLHVAAASCTVARALSLNEDLTQAIALGHDLGHAPFGHHGETVLTELAQKHHIPHAAHFQHEIHGLRVVDKLAQLDREPCGLNLTFAVRDGIISHCGESHNIELKPQSPHEKNLDTIQDKKDVGMPTTYEGCIVRMVDRIVYAGRDLEDALKAGIVQKEDVAEELSGITTLLGKNNGEIIGTLLKDLISNGEDGRIALSSEISQALDTLIAWNYEKIYKQEKVEKYKEHAKRGMTHLFSQLLSDITNTERFQNDEKSRCLPETPETHIYSVFKNFINDVGYSPAEPDERIVLDFIAGMTDNYLIKCISEIFVPLPVA